MASVTPPRTATRALLRIEKWPSRNPSTFNGLKPLSVPVKSPPPTHRPALPGRVYGSSMDEWPIGWRERCQAMRGGAIVGATVLSHPLAAAARAVFKTRDKIGYPWVSACAGAGKLATCHCLLVTY